MGEGIGLAQNRDTARHNLAIQRRLASCSKYTTSQATVLEFGTESKFSAKKTPKGTWHYEWNAAGMLSKVIRPDKEEVTFAYDTLGLAPLDQSTRLALLQLLQDRYAKRSTIIASQLPVSKWHENLVDTSLADAIMDRVTTNAQRIKLKGPSLRSKKSKENL